MDDSHRPVKLRKVVLGFPKGNNYSDFRFDLSLNYKLSGIIQTYSDRKPTLVVSKICDLSLIQTYLFGLPNHCQYGSHQYESFKTVRKTPRRVSTTLFCRAKNEQCYQSTQ